MEQAGRGPLGRSRGADGGQRQGACDPGGLEGALFWGGSNKKAKKENPPFCTSPFSDTECQARMNQTHGLFRGRPPNMELPESLVQLFLRC